MPPDLLNPDYFNQENEMPLDAQSHIPAAKEKKARSIRFLMTLALRKAQKAVELDNKDSGAATILAYKEAIDTLSLVLCYNKDEEIREKIVKYQKTYIERINFLKSQKVPGKNVKKQLLSIEKAEAGSFGSNSSLNQKQKSIRSRSSSRRSKQSSTNNQTGLSTVAGSSITTLTRNPIPLDSETKNVIKPYEDPTSIQVSHTDSNFANFKLSPQQDTSTLKQPGSPNANLALSNDYDATGDDSNSGNPSVGIIYPTKSKASLKKNEIIVSNPDKKLNNNSHELHPKTAQNENSNNEQDMHQYRLFQLSSEKEGTDAHSEDSVVVEMFFSDLSIGKNPEDNMTSTKIGSDFEENKNTYPKAVTNLDFDSNLHPFQNLPQRQHSANTDSANTDSANTDSANTDSANTDSASTDSANIDSTNIDSTNIDSTNIDSKNVTKSSNSNLLGSYLLSRSANDTTLKIEISVSTSTSTTTSADSNFYIESAKSVPANDSVISSSVFDRDDLLNDGTLSSNREINDISSSPVMDPISSIQLPSRFETSISNSYDLFSPNQNKLFSGISSEFLSLDSDLSFAFASTPGIDTSNSGKTPAARTSAKKLQDNLPSDFPFSSYSIKIISPLNYAAYSRVLFPTYTQNDPARSYTSESGISSFSDINKQSGSRGDFNKTLMKLCYSKYNNPLRPMWLIRLLLQSMSPDGGYVTPTLFLSQKIWLQDLVRFSAVDQKLSAIDKISPRFNNLKNINLPNVIYSLPENCEMFETLVKQVPKKSLLLDKSDLEDAIGAANSLFEFERLRKDEMESLVMACSKMGSWLDDFDFARDKVRKSLRKKLKFILANQELASVAFSYNLDFDLNGLRYEKAGNNTTLALVELSTISNTAHKFGPAIDKKIPSMHHKLPTASDNLNSTTNPSAQINNMRNDRFPINTHNISGDHLFSIGSNQRQAYMGSKNSKNDYSKDSYSASKLKLTPSRLRSFGKIRKSVDRFYSSISKDKTAESVAYMELMKYLLDLVLNFEEFLLYFAQLALVPESDRIYTKAKSEYKTQIGSTEYFETRSFEDKKHRKNSAARFNTFAPTLKSPKQTPLYYTTSESLQPKSNAGESTLSSSSSFQLPPRPFNSGIHSSQSFCENYQPLLSLSVGKSSSLPVGGDKSKNKNKLVESIVRAALVNPENSRPDYERVVREACHKVCKMYGKRIVLDRTPSAIFFRLLDVSEWLNSVLLPWVFHDMHILLLHHTKKTHDWIVS